jgi:two-component system CheB/CheR fusion protein
MVSVPVKKGVHRPVSKAAPKMRSQKRPPIASNQRSARKSQGTPPKSQSKSGIKPSTAKTLSRRGNGKAQPAFPVVAVGASAGGLEAFTQLLQQLPVNTGMAFVFIQHLDPRYASQMPDLLARVTAMPVVEAANRQVLEPNRVYVMPSNAQMRVSDGILNLSPRAPAGSAPISIDEFCEALAHDCGRLAIGVVLSGTGTDGTLGLAAIRAEGGITFAQDEPSAKFAGMPHSAAAAGVADFILPPDEIGRQLAHLPEHPYVRPTDLPGPKQPAETPDDEAAMRQIIGLLKQKTGIDFVAYRKTSLGRRIQRRMMLTDTRTLPAYAAHVQDEEAELARLHDDIFIHVTSFFRDSEVYEVLQRAVFPELVDKQSSKAQIRVWVPGCSTGEEAYSLAISWMEFTENQPEQIPFQLFGTDISKAAIDKARVGRYPEGIAASVSPERLRRFFVQVPGGYQIAKPVRDLCVFAPHDLLSDPPFSQLDLLCCRNVLIYLEPEFQHKLLQLYHYVLRPGGNLVLGLSEDIGKLNSHFAVVDKKHRIYAKRLDGQRPHLDHPSIRLPWERAQVTKQIGAAYTAESAAAPDVWAAADKLVLNKYAPVGVIVDENLEILQYRGRVGAFLEPAPGHPSRNLSQMAREGLQQILPNLVRKAFKTNAAVRRDGLRIGAEDVVRLITVEATPFQLSAQSIVRYCLVTFEEMAARTQRAMWTGQSTASKKGRPGKRQALLQNELDETRENLQQVITEREANGAELMAALEELQSGNEELQSTNEELQTAKEELQSTNEELTTLNEELENRNHELSLAMGNLNNVIASVRIPIVIVGGDLRIRLYNSAAEKVLNVVATDIGRLMGEVKMRFEAGDLEAIIREVMRTRQPYNQEVQDPEGGWYAMRIRPYQSLENKIDGAVLTWSDVTALKSSLTSATEARDYLAAVVATMREPLIMLNADALVQTANHAFYDVFQTSPEETEQRPLYELGDHRWDVPELRRSLAEILTGQVEFHGLELELELPGVGRRMMLLNARRVQPARAAGELILLAIDDITAIKELVDMEQLRQLSNRLEAVREEERTRLSREIHDELGGALTGLKMQLHQLRRGLGEAQAPLRDITVAMSEQIDQEIVFIRKVAARLRPALLDDIGLAAAIDWQLGEFQKQTGLRAQLLANTDEVGLAPDALITAFRILQEALTNITRHAQASAVEVTLEVEAALFMMSIHDNGRGVAPEALSRKGSLGVRGMRERAQQAGGQLEIVGAPGQGTTIRLRLPRSSSSAAK